MEVQEAWALAEGAEKVVVRFSGEKVRFDGESDEGGAVHGLGKETPPSVMKRQRRENPRMEREVSADGRNSKMSCCVS